MLSASFDPQIRINADRLAHPQALGKSNDSIGSEHALVMPPSPFVSPEAVVGMGVYTARAMLQGKGHDVWEMMVENIP